MDARKDTDRTTVKNQTTTERKSERELVFTRTFNAPAHIVYQAWTTPELFKQWWAPKSFGVTISFVRARYSCGRYLPSDVRRSR